MTKKVKKINLFFNKYYFFHFYTIFSINPVYESINFFSLFDFAIDFIISLFSSPIENSSYTISLKFTEEVD